MTTSTTRTIASRIVCDDRVDRLLDEVGRVVDDVYLTPAGKLFDSSAIVALICLGRRDGVGAGKLEDAEADGRVLVEVGVDAVVERGELDARHVLQAHDGSCRSA